MHLNNINGLFTFKQNGFRTFRNQLCSYSFHEAPLAALHNQRLSHWYRFKNKLQWSLIFSLVLWINKNVSVPYTWILDCLDQKDSKRAVIRNSVENSPGGRLQTNCTGSIKCGSYHGNALPLVLFCIGRSSPGLAMDSKYEMGQKLATLRTYGNVGKRTYGIPPILRITISTLESNRQTGTRRKEICNHQISAQSKSWGGSWMRKTISGQSTPSSHTLG